MTFGKVDMVSFITRKPPAEIPWEFDIGLFDQIVEKIVPISNTELLFKLKCGLELKEVLPK